MIFIGTTFFGGKHILDPTPTGMTGINHLTLRDGTYDHLFVSKKPYLYESDINNFTDIDTVMNADFSENFDAGNSGFSLKTTDTVVVKIREKSTYAWQTIHVIEVERIEDFNFSLLYKYCQSKMWYEVRMSSYLNGIESCNVTQEVYSDFDGMYIMDSTSTYGTVYDVKGIDVTKNINNAIIEVLNDRYATVFSNGMADYESGTASGTFVYIEDCKSLNHEKGNRLRANVMDFLCSRKPKILKLYDGRIWMVKVTGKPTDTNESSPLIRQISFEWVEVGDIKSTASLCRNGLLNIPEIWR